MVRISILSLLLSISVLGFSQPSGWDVNSSDFEYSMTVTGIVEYEGEAHGQAGDYVAAFVGSECRGLAEAKYEEAQDKVFFYLTVFSNTYQGDKVELKFYNSPNGQKIDCTNEIDFTDGDNQGTASAPYTLVLDGEITAIKDVMAGAAFKCFPNPATSFIKIEGTVRIKTVEVADVLGKTVVSPVQVNHDSYKLDVSGLPRGRYFLIVNPGPAQEITNFIKQ